MAEETNNCDISNHQYRKTYEITLLPSTNFTFGCGVPILIISLSGIEYDLLRKVGIIITTGWPL